MAEIDSLVIIDHFKNLDKAQRVEFRQKVLEATGMGYTTFYNKITQKNLFSKSECAVIAQLIHNNYVAQN